jgi:hypothetical protein
MSRIRRRNRYPPYTSRVPNPFLATPPTLTTLPALTYVAARVEVTMESIGERVAEAFDELERYMASRGIEPAGPSLIRYRTVSVDTPFVVEAGWVTAEGIWIDAPYVAELLPAGVYATATHVGPYGELGTSTGDLLHWADAAAVTFAAGVEPDDHEWGCWYEFYVTDPVEGADGPSGTVEIRMLSALSAP